MEVTIWLKKLLFMGKWADRLLTRPVRTTRAAQNTSMSNLTDQSFRRCWNIPADNARSLLLLKAVR